MFNLEQFKKQLAQTIAWCAPHVKVDDVGNSLRTILPEKVRNLGDYDLNMRLVQCVIDIRAILLEDSYREFTRLNKPILPLPSGLMDGRLLVFYPGMAISDPAAEAETTYFNDITIPAWDTWVYHGTESNVLYNERYGKWQEIEYLICWIPPQIIDQVDEGIKVDPTECIQWLAKTDLKLGFFERLKGF